MSRSDDAVDIFKNGLNCTQSILWSYWECLGVDRDSALKIGTAFGGGIAKRGGTCGAVSGALMVIGLRYGSTDAKDFKARNNVYAIAEKFMKEFEARNTTVNCRELIGFDISQPFTPERTKIISETCPNFIRDAVDIVEELIKG